MLYNCCMKLYLVTASEFDRYHKKIFTYNSYMWGNNVSHIEEQVKSMSSRYTLTNVELITFKDAIEYDGTI